jgi:hypothetical protein
MFNGLLYRNDRRGLYNGLGFWITSSSPSGVILRIHVLLLLSIPNFHNLLGFSAFNLFLPQYCLND